MKREIFFPQTEPQCPLSDPAANPHKLCQRYDPPLSICFSCQCREHLQEKKYYYYCATCDLEFHRGCHYLPPEIRHPFHLLHPLTLTFSERFDNGCYPIYYSSSSTDSDTEDYGSDENHQKCKYCQKNLVDGAYYHCSICSFNLHASCAMNKPPLSIEHPKSHDHTLTLFPRLVPFPCDACGFSLASALSQVYSCLLCNYLVHRSCIYLPRVIKITRHPHRLSFTPSTVPSVDHLSCGVCRRSVDVNYGHYSCNKGCHYVAHSQCATRKEVWDGKDLESVPEEEEDEDIEPFVRIDEETIQHFSHENHYLRLDANGDHRNHENKFCQACTLGITVSDRFYSCIQCDFVLHETCAGLPRKKNHPLHKHSLTLLHPFSLNPCELRPDNFYKGYCKCNGCKRLSCGFVYKCNDKDCDFQLDVRCASLPDPSMLELHEHPLFFNLTKGECMGCQYSECSEMYLECIECELFLGVRCATSPRVAYYKHDKHPLTLCCGEKKTADLQYWCEVCEKKLDATDWFYTCNSCQVTIHLSCLFGKDIYMKPKHIIRLLGENVDIGYNNGNFRPVCDRCGRRCIYPFLFKWLDRNFCDRGCTWAFLYYAEEEQEK